MHNVYSYLKTIARCLCVIYSISFKNALANKHPLELRNELFSVYFDSAVGNEVNETPLEDSKQYIKVAHFLNEDLVFNILDTSLSFNSNNSLFLIDNIFEGILSIERDQYKDFINGCAESCVYDKDTLTWSIILKENLKWSDGSSLTADDFVRFIRAQFNPRFYKDNVINPIYKNELLSNSNYKNALKVLSGDLPVETIGVWSEGPLCLKLQYENTDPINGLHSKFLFLYPLHSSYIENFDYGKKIIDLEKIISNGPFKIKKRYDNKCIILEKNPYYWDSEKVILKELKFLLFENELQCLRAWQHGDVDVSPFSRSILGDRDNLDSQNITPYPCSKFRCLCINNSDKLLHIPKMRKALYYFLSYELFPFDSMLKIGEKMFGFLDSKLAKNYDIPSEFTDYSQIDCITGKRLIRSLKLKPKKTIKLKLLLNPTEPFSSNFETLLKNGESLMQPAPINSKRSEIYENILDGDFEIAIWSCYFLPELYSRYRILFSFDKDFAYNFVRFHNENYNEALLNMKDIYNEESIINLESIFYQEHPIVTVFMERKYYAVSSDIGNWNRIYNNYSRNGDIYYKKLFKKKCVTL